MLCVLVLEKYTSITILSYTTRGWEQTSKIEVAVSETRLIAHSLGLLGRRLEDAGLGFNGLDRIEKNNIQKAKMAMG